MYFGNRAALDRGLNGSIYAFRMYDYALSPAEVKALYDGRTALYPSQDSLGFAVTQTTVKDLQWFVRNPTSTVEVNAVEPMGDSRPSIVLDINQRSIALSNDATINS